MSQNMKDWVRCLGIILVGCYGINYLMLYGKLTWMAAYLSPSESLIFVLAATLSLLFTSPPYTGKTILAYLIAKVRSVLGL